MRYADGTKVKIVSETYGWGKARLGDIAVVTSSRKSNDIHYPEEQYFYQLDVEGGKQTHWSCLG